MVKIQVQNKQLNPYYTNVSISREIDGICSFAFEYPLSDSFSSLLTTAVQVDFYISNTVIFSGRITNISDAVSNSTISRKVSGVGLLDDLRKKIIPPNILHNNEFIVNSFNPSFANTVILDDTWTVTTESLGDVVTYLTSLQSSLSAISTFCQLTGYHYRYTNSKKLEIYKSLVSTGITIQNTSNQGNYKIDSKTLIIDGEISHSTDSTQLFNYVYAVGGTSDNGINQITLRDVTVTNPLYPIGLSPIAPNTDSTYTASPYTNIESAPNTTIAYVVSSPASIAKYGQIEKTIAKKDIHVSSSNTTTFSNVDRKEAATQLYRSIVEELKLNEEPQATYSVNASGGFIDMKVGQTILLKSSKTITDTGLQAGSGKVFDYNETLILTKYTITFAENETYNYQLELSNIPKVVKGDIETLTDTIETVNDYERQRKGSVTTYPQYFKDSFDSLHPLTGLFWIPEDFVYVDKLKLKIKIQAFRSYSTGATASVPVTSIEAGGSSSPSSQAGGSSSPTSQSGGSSSPTSQAGGSTSQSSTVQADHTHPIGNHTHNFTDPIHSHQIMAPSGNGTFGRADLVPIFATPGWAEYSDVSGNLRTIMNFALSPNSVMSSGGAGGTITSTSSGGATGGTNGGSHSHVTLFPPHTHVTDIPPHTHITDISPHTHITDIPPHTHVINISGQTISTIYGIFEDTANPPTGLKLFIDGIDYSAQISIPDGFGETPSSIDSTDDLLLAIHNLGQFANIFTPGIHRIELRCASGRALGELHLYGQFYLQSK